MKRILIILSLLSFIIATPSMSQDKKVKKATKTEVKKEVKKDCGTCKEATTCKDKEATKKKEKKIV